jgi:hypothetical protein
MRALWIVMVLASPAAADWRDLQGGAWAHYEASDVHDGDAPTKFTDLTLVGFRLHGFVSRHRIGWHIGLDAAGGATFGTPAGSMARASGFAYDVALLPVGVALRWGGSQMIGLGAGVGAMGAIGTLDDAATFPVEGFAEFGLGSHVRVLARGRAAYLAGADGHALDGMLALRVGHAYDDYGMASGNGYFAGVAYRELAGARYVGLVLGYSIDLAYPHRRSGRVVE